MAISYAVESKTDKKTVRCAFYCDSKPKGERTLYAQFNPEDGLKWDRSATYTEMTSPGMNYPIFQYVRGNSYHLEVELFFYDFLAGKHSGDIREAQEWLMSLLPPEVNKKAKTTVTKKKGKKKTKKGKIPSAYTPPTFDFRFGYFKEKFVMEKVDIHDEVFAKNGKPVQSRVTVNMIRVGSNTHF